MPTIGRLRYLDAAAAFNVRFRGTLVLIHAFPLNARMWEPQLVLAEQGWRVVVPQLRGFDRGDADPMAASVDDYAGDIIDLLDALHVKEAVFGGLSMGGHVIFAIARHAPQYIRALILADTRHQADTPEAVEGRKRLLQVLKQNGVEAVADEMIPRLLGESSRAGRPDVCEQVRSLILANPAEAVAGAIQALMTRPDSTATLQSIHCPTMIIAGEEDTLTPPVVARELQHGIAGSELVLIGGAGHLSNLEQPAAFNDALIHFLTHRV